MDILFSGSRNRNAGNERLRDQSQAASIGRLLLAISIIAGAVFVLDRASGTREHLSSPTEGEMR